MPTSATQATQVTQPVGATTKPGQTIVPLWGQCGGVNYIGSTNCGPGNQCFYQSEWYSQCTPL